MCTNIIERAAVEGSAKGPRGWFSVERAYVGYDHPVHARLEHAVSLDFVTEGEGVGARVGVELSPTSARALAGAILQVLDQAGAGYSDTRSASAR